MSVKKRSGRGGLGGVNFEILNATTNIAMHFRKKKKIIKRVPSQKFDIFAQNRARDTGWCIMLIDKGEEHKKSETE